MGTLSEEILSHNIKRQVCAGEIIIANLDYVLSHDTTTPLAIEALSKLPHRSVWNNNQTLIFFDHIVPASSIQAASLHKKIRGFVSDQMISNVFQEGISHQLMVEKHFAAPGRVIIGADSHSCTHGAVGCFSTGMGSTDIAVGQATGKIWLKVPETIELKTEGKLSPGVFPKDLILHQVGTVGAEGANYKAIEYTGSTIRQFSIEERMTLTSMAVEMGAKVGLVEPDEITMKYTRGQGTIITCKNPVYEESLEFEAENIVPKIAAPHRVDNVYDIDQYLGMNVDQVFVGTCTNGRISDLEIVAKLLKGKKIDRKIRMVITPASISIQMEAYRRGFIDIFNEAGAITTNPGCGPCIGRHQGVLAPDEVALTTMNRNFQGRMGSPDAGIYLSSPATAVLTAIHGKIVDARDFIV